MAANTAFDNEKYILEQRSEILERARKFDNKLYLEFGGKLLFDNILHGKDKKQKKKIGRNDPCPCGSGKKFKKCCLL